MSRKLVVDESRLYRLEDVAERVHLGERVLRDLVKDPACPLKLVKPRHGRQPVCTGVVLGAFLEWLVSEDAPRAEAG
jgi:hypothetical protein